MRSHLGDCCARELQLIAIHQLLLNMQLDRMVLDQLVEADAGTDEAQGADIHRDDELRPPADG